MNISTATDLVFRWPAPPYFDVVAAPAAGYSRDCKVELLDGRVCGGRLTRVQNEAGPVSLRLEALDANQPFDPGAVRVVRLAVPVTLALAHNQALTEAADTAAGAAAHEKPFVVKFRDGGQLSGRTRGFVRNRDGLFLYLVQDDASKTVPCYIPERQLQDVTIGPPIGETLTASQQVSSAALAAALNKQAKLRDQRLGEYLTDRAIITVADLTRALKTQSQGPWLKLGEFLVQEQLITAAQLGEALDAQRANRRRRLGDILIDMGVVTEQEVQRALSEKLGIPFVDARRFVVDPATLQLVPDALAITHQVLPLLRAGETLVVAVANPLAMDFAEELQFATSLNIVPAIASAQDLKLRIAQEYMSDAVPDLHEVSAIGDDGAGRHAEKLNISELTSELAKEVRAPPTPRRGREQAEARVMDNVLVRLVNKIIVEAHAQGASDIHIESNPRNLNTHIRFRKDGDLDEYLELQPAFRSALVSRIKIMANLDIAEHRRAQDGKIDFGRFGPIAIELRVAVIPTSNGLEDVVMRILGGVEPLPLAGLGLNPRDLDALQQMVTHSHGLILVCGPTGCGKTTTLHSVMRHINRPDMKIWTAEDPIEITQTGLRQVQVNPKIGWTFAEAMRAFLRADPDVIMVGEMRDVETSKMGIEASLTGHLVLSTLHTNSAAESVVRLLDLGMDPFNFADALVGILSQRLARKLCPRCRKKHVASAEELTELAREYCEGSVLQPDAVIEQWRRTAPGGVPVLYEAVGCKECKDGYRGRLGVYELLPGTPKIKQLVRSRATVPQLVEAAQEGGMRLLKQDAIDKVLSGALDLVAARTAAT